MSELLCPSCGGNLDEEYIEVTENNVGDLEIGNYKCENCKKVYWIYIKNPEKLLEELY